MLLELLLFVFLLYLVYKFDEKPKNLPPGRWGLPFVGVLSTHATVRAETVKQLRATYGDIFSVRIGGRLVVFITDFPTMKAALNMPELQGRPDYYTFRQRNHFQNIGLVFSEGEVWRIGRRFTLRQLRDLGVGKSYLEDSIQVEAAALVDHLMKDAGKPRELMWEVNVAVLNIIWQLVAHKRFDINDATIQEFTRLVNVNILLLQGPASYLDTYKNLFKWTPKFIANRYMKIDQMHRNRDNILEFLTTFIEENKKTLDPSNPRDYIDHYLLEMEKEKDDPNTTFRSDYLGLKISILNLFVAGSETTSSTIRWMALCMAKFPEEQKKIHKLIDEHVARDAVVTLQDKENLVYLEAMLLEVLRFSSLLPQSLAHCATADTTLRGYTIPQGTVVIACTELCHHDPAYWERPNDFYPPHFIDDEGNLVTKKDGFAPFSIGRRQCLGENLARVELFLFCASILQRFTITPAPGEPLDLTVNRTNTLLNFVKPYKVILTPRY